MPGTKTDAIHSFNYPVIHSFIQQKVTKNVYKALIFIINTYQYMFLIIIIIVKIDIRILT